MPLTREKKEDLVTRYTEMLQNSRALIVTDYRGLNTTEMTKLRRRIREADASLVVIKNRLFRLAMQNAGLDMPPDFLDGPVAAAFTRGDVPPVAKALTEFAVSSEILVVKGGLLEENFLSHSEIQALADLPPLEVLRAQFLGLLAAPSSNIAGVMASSVSGVVNVLSARVREGGGVPESAPAASNGADSDEAPAESEEQPAAEAEAETPAADASEAPEAEAADEAEEEEEAPEEETSEEPADEEADAGEET